MKGAQYLVRALEREGVEILFGYPGGAIMPVYDALVDASFKHVLVRHEQGAALAASGYARATGRVGVCMATSGPGATNLVTGIADAFLDSIPIVAITGQVASPFIGTDAFQEVDILGITMPIVKHGFLPRKPSDLSWMIREAFHIARTGRPGPVIIDLPKDVSLMDVPDAILPPKPEERPPSPAEEEIEKAVRLYSSSRRPVVYVGGGVQMGRAIETFRKFVKETRLPVVSTLKGLGTIPGDYELFLGMLGMHGTQAANHAVQRCDLLIVVGARFDDRATGKLAEFAPEAKVIHLDIDPCEISKLREANCGLIGWLEPGLDALTFALPDSSIGEWRRECRESRARYSIEYDPQGRRHLCPAPLEESLPPCRSQDHHYERRRPASNVGRAAFRFSSSRATSDFGRVGYDGLRPAGGDWGAVWPYGSYGDCGYGRRLDHDEYPGTGDD